MNCCVAGARFILEVAAELDPDTYVPILDLLDADSEDLEDDDREDEPPEAGDELQTCESGVRIVDHCPCCGHVTGIERWTT